MASQPPSRVDCATRRKPAIGSCRCSTTIQPTLRSNFCDDDAKLSSVPGATSKPNERACSTIPAEDSSPLTSQPECFIHFRNDPEPHPNSNNRPGGREGSRQ